MLAATVVVAVWLAALADTDRCRGILPNRLLWPGALGVVAVTTITPVVGMAGLVAAAVYLPGFVARWCGGGDVKLAFVLGGLVADPARVLPMVFLAQVFWLVGRRRRRRYPHGPALISACAVTFATG